MVPMKTIPPFPTFPTVYRPPWERGKKSGFPTNPKNGNCGNCGKSDCLSIGEVLP
jgi:hypothetical protein